MSPDPSPSRTSSIAFFEDVLGIGAAYGVLRAAEQDPGGLQVHPDGLVLDPDAGLLGHVVGQPPQRPQRERQPQATGPPADRPEQPFLMLLGYLNRRARARNVAQPFDPLGEVEL